MADLIECQEEAPLDPRAEGSKMIGSRYTLYLQLKQ